MIGNVIYVKRSLFASTDSIVNKLSRNLGVKRKIDCDQKCIILENKDMMVAIRKDMIDVMLLTDVDNKRKREIYSLTAESI